MLGRRSRNRPRNSTPRIAGCLRVAQSLHTLPASLLASRDCQCLILVASPRLLSEFRVLLPKALQKKVLVEYSRNLARLPLTTLNIRLRPSVLSAVRLLAEGPMK